MDVLKEIIDEFGILSSAKVNWAKSIAFVCGEWEGKSLPRLPGGLEWKKDGFKYLGVYLGDESMMRKNWEGVLEKMREGWKNGSGCGLNCLLEDGSSLLTIWWLQHCGTGWLALTLLMDS